MLPLILAAGGGDPCERYQIARSVRFNSPDTAYLTRTPGASGNRKTVFYSGWVKRGQLVDTALYSAGAVNNFIAIMLGHGADPYKLVVYQENGAAQVMRVVTSRLFRDIAAHCHVKVLIDTTQATAANRVRVWIDGVEETSFSTASYPALNLDTYFNHAVAHYIGHYAHNASHFGDYLLSEVRATDGVIPAVSDVGFVCPSTGQWRPKKYDGTYGTNGFHLDFSDNSAATSGTLGKDRSGNNNDWTPVNISVAGGVGNDSLTDTPTNNFCTWNPLAPGASFLTNGALDSIGTVPGTFPMISGSWCWEISVVGNYALASVVSATGTVSTETQIDAATTKGLRFNADTGALDWTSDGSTWNSLATGLTSGPYFIRVNPAGGGTASLNCGQRPYSLTQPTGFKSLCTKNLPVPAIKKPSTAFVAKTDSGANIAATLAAARSGWTDYIEIFKRRDAAEGWRWRFSNDLTNYLDSSSTAAKAAFPALGGTSYVGYALKVAAANGVATGTFAHTNGVADTITDGLGNTRKMIILKREDGVSDWLTFHPDLTAGKLLYLNTTASETIDASIGNVLSNSFVAAAALATGTYRWIALADLSGIISLNTYTGNGSSDGPMITNNLRPAFALIHGKSIAEGWLNFDNARNPTNVANLSLRFHQSNAEVSGTYLADLDANGFKYRISGVDGNNSGSTYISVAIAEFPFKYANAR